MKLRPAILLTGIMLALLASACTSTTPDSSEMPLQRPADFKIAFSEGGGPEVLGARYIVDAKLASYERKLSYGDVAVSEFEPRPAALDSLYAFVRGSGITGIRAQTEGEASDRFGYQMEIVYAGNRFRLADQGNQYIRLEADFNTFKDVLAEVRAFIGKGLDKYKSEVTANVTLDAKAPRPDSLSVVLEEISLIDLRADDEAGDTLQGSFTAMQGTYRMSGFANVAGKEWTWSKEILLTKPTRVNLQLGKDGFVEIADSAQK
ncbi:MAG: hypothetical protein RLZZ519_179 [Bacteroidota bacterium]|jgi:hypothetical protein